MRPEIRTIMVPADIKPEYIGEYVSDRVRSIIDDIGLGQINPKSLTIKCQSIRFYTLHFDSNNGYTLPHTLTIRNTMERSEESEQLEFNFSGGVPDNLRKLGEVASRSEGTSSKKNGARTR